VQQKIRVYGYSMAMKAKEKSAEEEFKTGPDIGRINPRRPGDGSAL
jgi:hypothetical protein